MALCVLGLVAACGVAPVGLGLETDDMLFLTTASGITIQPAGDGRGLAVEGAVASPDHEVLASASSDGTETVVRRLDPSGGKLSRVVVPGELQARVVSDSGELVALTEPRVEGTAPYLPEAKADTRVVVAGADGHREYALEGNFEPEAFKIDDRELFLIEYIPALAPERYRVRRLRLHSGKLLPIGRLKGFAPEQMQGTGRTQVYAPYGDELYTLYTQQDEAGHAVTSHDQSAHAFVHLLNLDGSWAHCIDLPHEFASGPATASALAITHDGTRLFVVDWTSGVIAAVNPARVKVIETNDVGLGAPDDETFAAATNELLYVGGNDEVVVVDGDDLEIVDRWRVDGEITGLGLGSDGEILYVSLPGRIAALDAATGEEIGAMPTNGAVGIDAIDS